MQEYILAKEGQFLCGSTVIENDTLGRFIRLYKRLNLGDMDGVVTPLISVHDGTRAKL